MYISFVICIIYIDYKESAATFLIWEREREMYKVRSRTKYFNKKKERKKYEECVSVNKKGVNVKYSVVVIKKA